MEKAHFFSKNEQGSLYYIGFLLLTFFLIFYTNIQAKAVGVGEVKLYSKLNQPLKAIINLVDTGSLSSNDFFVSLGSKTEDQVKFTEQLPLLRGLEFSVQQDSKSSGIYVVISSKEPIKIPYLHFFVEFKWPDGGFSKEFTFLFDMPALESVKVDKPINSLKPPVNLLASEASEASEASQVQHSKASQVQLSKEPKALPEVKNAINKTTSVNTVDIESKKKIISHHIYKVKSGDTLSEIAERFNPDNIQFTTDQVMIAFLRMNANAFISHNIFKLKKDSELKVPTAAVIKLITKNQAEWQINMHHKNWLRSKNSHNKLDNKVDEIQPVSLPEPVINHPIAAQNVEQKSKNEMVEIQESKVLPSLSIIKTKADQSSTEESLSFLKDEVKRINKKIENLSEIIEAKLKNIILQNHDENIATASLQAEADHNNHMPTDSNNQMTQIENKANENQEIAMDVQETKHDSGITKKNIISTQQNNDHNSQNMKHQSVENSFLSQIVNWLFRHGMVIAFICILLAGLFMIYRKYKFKQLLIQEQSARVTINDSAKSTDLFTDHNEWKDEVSLNQDDSSLAAISNTQSIEEDPLQDSSLFDDESPVSDHHTAHSDKIKPNHSPNNEDTQSDDFDFVPDDFDIDDEVIEDNQNKRSDKNINKEDLEPVSQVSDDHFDELFSDLESFDNKVDIENKLLLAKTYIDMDDQESAVEILQEIIETGTPEQIKTAKDLFSKL